MSLQRNVSAATPPLTATPGDPRGWQAIRGHHYTVAELAEAWNVSTDFIRELFRGESDVVRWVRNRPGKRRYVTVRVPAGTAERVYRRALQRA